MSAIVFHIPLGEIAMSLSANTDWVDFLLADIARRIQLSETDYFKAQERYRAVSTYIAADASPIAHLSPYIYPQGSFRTQTTISSNVDGEEYDIDLVLELDMDPDQDPDQVLTSLHDALDRGPGSQYHGKCTIKKRCVTIDYADGMHLDVTPAVLVNPTNPRTSVIYDRHPDRDNIVMANPEGFALWFDEAILPTQFFEARMAAAKMDAEPVPDQKPLEDKPLRLLVLQLLKRFRDIRHTQHGYAKIPSVLLSKLVADMQSDSNKDNMYSLISKTVDFLITKMSGKLLYEENPRCEQDILTDRWPSSEGAQRKFLEDLGVLRSALISLREDAPMSKGREVLSVLFGEQATAHAVKAFSESLGTQARKGSLGITETGGVMLGGGASTIPSHKFFGE